MRILIAGDTHGDEKEIARLAAHAGERKISHLMIMGDFGLWTHRADGHKFLDTCQRVAEGNRLSIFAVGGNHENWDHWEWFTTNMPTSHGLAYVRERVLLSPKVHSFRMGGKNFAVAGGAVSVDKDWRLKNERGGNDGPMGRFVKGSGPRTLWWPNEVLVGADIDRFKLNHAGGADYLLSHDCSNFTPFKGRMKPDMDSQAHRQLMDEVIKASKPKIHFHGHMHTKYDWNNAMSHGFYPGDSEAEGYFETRTIGLQCNEEAQRWASEPFTGDNWVVLDTENDEVAWQGEGMNFRSLEPPKEKPQGINYAYMNN